MGKEVIKGFIEVTTLKWSQYSKSYCQFDGEYVPHTKRLLNINAIDFIDDNFIKTSSCYRNDNGSFSADFNVAESYEEIKELIKQSQ